MRIQQKEEQENETEYIRKGLVVMAFIAVLLAISIPSIIRLWYIIGSIIVPGILFPFLMTFTNTKLKEGKIILTMIIPVITAIFWFIYGNFLGHYPMEIEPFYPGIIISALFIGIWKK